MTSEDGLPDDAATHEAGHAGASGAGVDDLDQRLAGALERVGHVTRTMLSRQAYVDGVSPLQLQLLLRLEAAMARPRVSDLAVELDVSQATISEALAALRRKGLVAKEQDPADRRNSVFTTTPAGVELRDRLAEWDRPLTARLAPLSEDEKGTALRVVLGLIADLQTDGVINVARTCMTCRYFDGVSHPSEPAPYHCLLLDTAFGDPQLRVDCREHEPRASGG